MKEPTMTSDNGLGIHVHVAPMRPVPDRDAQEAGIRPMWSPCSSTLITSETEALLVDTLITYDQVDVLTRAKYEAADLGYYWRGVFGDQIPTDPALPELLEGDTISLDGHPLCVLDIGQGDTENSTILHMPQIDAVVAGDVCYNQVHMMTAWTDDAARQAWIANLDAIAALNPSIVVSGHKRVDAPDSPDTIEQSKQYLRDYSRVASEQDTVEGIVAEMLKLHGDRDNPYTLWLSARRVVGNRS